MTPLCRVLTMAHALNVPCAAEEPRSSNRSTLRTPYTAEDVSSWLWQQLPEERAPETWPSTFPTTAPEILPVTGQSYVHVCCVFLICTRARACTRVCLGRHVTDVHVYMVVRACIGVPKIGVHEEFGSGSSMFLALLRAKKLPATTAGWPSPGTRTGKPMGSQA